jgi:TetR/AcrR family transcriptional regulator, cholesterol catabolism regulator
MDHNLRTNIKKTAAKLFLKYGLRSISIDDICNELRISKKTFYTCFNQKEELIESVLMEQNEKRLKQQEFKSRPCQSEGNAIDHLVGISDFHTSTKSDKFVNFFYDLRKYYPEIHKRLKQHNQKHIREKIRENILIGREEKLFRSDFDLELMVHFLAIQFIAVNNLTSKELGTVSMRRSIRLLMDVYIRILSNRQGLDYYEKLLLERSQENQEEKGQLGDEELDLIIDRMMDNPEELKEVVKNQNFIQ